MASGFIPAEYSCYTRKNSIITGIVLNVCDSTQTASDTAGVVISSCCGFTDPTAANPNCCGSATANYAVNKCDLLSVNCNR